MADPPLIDIDDLDEELRGLVKPELEPGERLLWAARGSQRYRPNSWIRGAIWTLGFGITSGAALGLMTRPEFQQIQGFLAFVVVVAGVLGLIILIATVSMGYSWRFERRRLSRAVYALTDRRAIAWTPRSESNAIEVISHPRGKYPSVYRVEYPDDSGDLYLDRSYAPVFQGVPDIRRVEELVRKSLIVAE